MTNTAKANTSRQASKEMTRQRLILSAHKLILEKGLSGLTMNQITRKAGIAQPSFYNHYSSLAELMQDVRQLMATRYLTPLQKFFVDTIQKWQKQTTNSRLNRQSLRALNQEYLQFNFDILLRDINIFKVVLADHHDQSSPIQGELGKLIDEVNLAWCDFLAKLANDHHLDISISHIQLYVDSLSALSHQLVLGCEQNRYTKEQAVVTLSTLSETLISDQLNFANTQE